MSAVCTPTEKDAQMVLEYIENTLAALQRKRSELIGGLSANLSSESDAELIAGP
jgi:hypothetical protein